MSGINGIAAETLRCVENVRDCIATVCVDCAWVCQSVAFYVTTVWNHPPCVTAAGTFKRKLKTRYLFWRCESRTQSYNKSNYIAPCLRTPAPGADVAFSWLWRCFVNRIRLISLTIWRWNTGSKYLRSSYSAMATDRTDTSSQRASIIVISYSRRPVWSLKLSWFHIFIPQTLWHYSRMITTQFYEFSCVLYYTFILVLWLFYPVIFKYLKSIQY